MHFTTYWIGTHGEVFFCKFVTVLFLSSSRFISNMNASPHMFYYLLSICNADWPEKLDCKTTYCASFIGEFLHLFQQLAMQYV